MKRATQTMAALMIGLGVALIVRTLTEGGFGVGLLLGLLFVAAGVGRLLLLRKQSHG